MIRLSLGLVKSLSVKQANHTVKSLGNKKKIYKITKQINVNVLKQYLSTIKRSQILLNSKVRNPKSRLLHLVPQPWLGRLGRHSKAPTG